MFLTVLGAGFICGSWLGIERGADHFSDAVHRGLLEPASIAKHADNPASAGTQTDDELISAMMSALGEEEPLLRDHRLQMLIGSLNSADLEVLFNRALKIDDRERREGILLPLLLRWEELDPIAAENTMRPILERLRSGKGTRWGSKDYAAIDAWARARPDLALAMAMTAPNSSWSKWLGPIGLAFTAGGDANKQLEILRRMDPNPLKARLSEQVLGSLGAKDYATAEANLDLITDPKDRARVQCDMLSSLAQRDPAAALARVTELAPELGSEMRGIRLVSAVMSRAAAKDPEATLKAVDSLPEELRTPALGAALVGWVDKNPKDALDWIGRNGVDPAEMKRVNLSDFGGVSWNTPLMAAFDHNREQTMAWLREQPPSGERDAMLATGLWGGSFDQRLEIFAELTPEARLKNIPGLFTRARGIDAAAAESWAQALPQGPARIAAVEGLVSSQLENDPGRAEELISKYSEGPERDAAMIGGVSALQTTEQEKAVELAAGIGDPTLRETAYVRVARSWLRWDKTSALAWLSSTQALDPDLKRVLIQQADER